MRRFDLPGRSPVYSENGMAATSHPLATLSAIDILKRGGNAVDAAVAASATLTIVEPQMTGIGGDCFAIVVEPDGTVHGLNGSGRAAAGVDPDWYRANGFREIPETGPHAVTVPGAVNAWETLLGRLGTLPFEALFADAIRLAEDGFPVHPRVGWDWARQVEALRADEGGSRPLSGRRQGAGHRRASAPAGARQDLARDRARWLEGLLRRADRRRDRCDDPQARRLHERSRPRRRLGRLGPADLCRLCRPRRPGDTAERARHHRAHHVPAAGRWSAPAAPIRDSAERYHLEIEAGRLAYSVRDHMVADPASMTASPAELLSDSFIAALAARIDPAQAQPGHFAAAGAERRHDLSDRRRPRPPRRLLHQLDLRRLRRQDRDAGIRHRAAKPRRLLLAGQGPSERDRPRQAADAHDHPGDGDEGRPGVRRLRRHGRRLPADGPCPCLLQPRRSRHGPAGGDRSPAPVLGRRRRARGRSRRA